VSAAGRDVDADAWGIVPGYHDIGGDWHETPPETRAALVAAMGGGTPQRAAVQVARPGQALPIAGPAELALEDGTALTVRERLPPDLPLGYHRLQPLEGGEPTRLIVPPEGCFLPRALRAWGWAVQLYALRSDASWGIGDLADLRRLARWSRDGAGAGMLLVSPLHAVAPLLPQQPSPYFPSSRRFHNPLYLRVEEAPGAAEADLDLHALATAGRALNAARRIDRDAVYRLKREALELLWRRFRDDGAFARYRAEQGVGLEQFATFQALAERQGGGWHAWPEPLRRPDGAAVARFAREQAERVGFHAWLQWLLDQQLARAGAELPLLQDLPIGVDPDGADAWAWQDVLALDASVGAPPDFYNRQGQDWGLPPFVPHALRAAGYEPFIQSIRATLRHAGGLRIDHVMGLFRLFWIPRGMGPPRGTYVRYPSEELLAILALESQRAGAFVVGEDLGTVEEGVRERLAALAILSYRLLWFEADPPAAFPRQALAAITTHDLPTIAGLWSGADLRHLRAIGLEPNEEGLRAMRQRLATLAGLADDAPIAEVIARSHRLLAQAPSMLVSATLEDALAVEERPNMPGTSREWPNWSLALPRPLEQIEADPLVHAVAAALERR